MLGIGAFVHDASAAIIVGDRVVAAAEEERFSRRKHTSEFPERAVAYCLGEAGLQWRDISEVAFYCDPRGAALRYLFHTALHPMRNLRGALFFQGRYSSPWRRIVGLGAELTRRYGTAPPVRFVDHHLAHAASTFYYSDFDRAAILSWDAMGDWSSTLLAEGAGTRLRQISAVNFPYSIGKLYTAITHHLGFADHEEGTTMALAALGAPDYIDFFRQIIAPTKHGYAVNRRYFDIERGAQNWWTDEALRVLGPPREVHEPLLDRHQALAASVQRIFEEIGLHLALILRDRSDHGGNIALAGGNALNCVFNGRLMRESGFERVFVQPAAHDAGASLGAALCVAASRGIRPLPPRTAALGPSYSSLRCEASARAAGLQKIAAQDVEAFVAMSILEGRIVGWFDGRLEFGPRALGHRSLLADPRSLVARDRLSMRIKARASFRPVAPSILLEDFEMLVHDPRDSPYMLMAFSATDSARARIPAAIHADGSMRVQVVWPDQEPRFSRLLGIIKKSIGVGAVLNTSFNLKGEPIVCTPEDAVASFLRSEIDILYMEGEAYQKCVPRESGVLFAEPQGVSISQTAVWRKYHDERVSESSEKFQAADCRLSVYRRQRMWLKKRIAHWPSSIRRVLDLGCGPGSDEPVVRESGRYWAGLDISIAALRFARDTGMRSPIAQCDLYPIPSRTGAVDAVIAFGPLMYSNDWRALAREINRILRPRGRLIISIASNDSLINRLSDRMTADDSAPARRNASPREIRRFLESSGLRVLHQSGIAGWPGLLGAWEGRLPTSFPDPSGIWARWVLLELEKDG